MLCDLGYLCANSSLHRSLCCRLRPDVRDRQTSDTHHRLKPPPCGGRGVITLAYDAGCVLTRDRSCTTRDLRLTSIVTCAWVVARRRLRSADTTTLLVPVAAARAWKDQFATTKAHLFRLSYNSLKVTCC